MPIYKASFDFTHQKNGWTETFYLDYADTRAALESAKEWRPFRVALMGGGIEGNGPRLRVIRVSDVSIQRDALQYKVPDINQYNLHGANADNSNLAVAVRCEATALYRRTWYISGQMDGLCVNGIYQPIAEFDNAINAARTWMLARPWGIYAQNKASATLNVVEITAPVAGLITVTTENPHGLAIGSVVQILRAPGMTNIRGKYFVKSTIGANGFTVAANPTGAYTGGGKVRKVDMILQRFTNLEVDGITRKSRGRPSVGPVGRRKRRAVA